MIEFDACARRMVDARHGFWQGFWCPLNGSCMFAAAQLLLEGWGIGVELVGWWGVLLALRSAVFLAVTLCQWGPCGWVLVLGCLTGNVASALGWLEVEV